MLSLRVFVFGVLDVLSSHGLMIPLLLFFTYMHAVHCFGDIPLFGLRFWGLGMYIG